MDGTIFRMTLDGQAAILAQMEFTPTLQFQGRDGRFYGTVSVIPSNSAAVRPDQSS